MAAETDEYEICASVRFEPLQKSATKRPPRGKRGGGIGRGRHKERIAAAANARKTRNTTK